ncbi:tetratricopeptide repeat protein [Melioribacter sp. OK-6-Me]|uniref:tetratricopeptide repeat protein n=1 Tax=unclassified Melioribacter TaxID=2627329 RepID=UPI003EDB27ED
MKQKIILLSLLTFCLATVKAQSLEEILDRATELYNQKNYSDSYRYYSLIIHSEGANDRLKAVALYYAGESLIKTSDYAAAATQFETLISDYPFSNYHELSLLRLGEIYYHTGAYRKCRERLFYFIEKYPESSHKGTAYFWLGESYAAENKFYEAVEHFNLSISNAQTNKHLVNAIYSLGTVYEKLGDYQEAISNYDELLSYYNNSELAPLAQLRIGICYFKIGDYSTATLELTNPLLGNLSDQLKVEKDYYLSNAFMRLGEYDKAEKIMSSLIATDISEETKRKIFYNIGWIKFQTKDYKGAYEIFNNLNKTGNDTISVFSLFWSAESKRYMNDRESAEQLYREFIENYPNHPLASKVNLSKGALLFEFATQKDAESVLINAAASNDIETKSRALTMLGELKLNEKKYNDARNYFSETLRINNNHNDSYKRAKLGKGISEFYLNKYREALDDIIFLYNKFRDFEKDKVNFYIAEIYMSLGDYEQAIKHYNLVSSDDPLLHKQVMIGKAYAYFNKKDFPNSVYYFNNYLKRYGNEKISREVKLRLADSYFGMKNFTKASEIYEDLFKKENVITNAQNYYQYCQALYKAGKTAQAIIEFSNLQKLFPHSNYNDDAQYVIGWIYFQQNQYDWAIDNYLRLIKEYPNSTLIPIAYYSIGDSYYNMGQYDSALVYYGKVLNKYPNTSYIIDAVNGIQYAYIAKNEIEKAIKVIDDFIKQYPDQKYSDQFYLKKGDIYYSIGDYNKAINAYYDFINKYQKSNILKNAYYWLGKSAVNTKNDTLAIDAFNQVLNLSLTSDISISAALELSNLYSTRNQFNKAIEVLNKVITNAGESKRMPELLFTLALIEAKSNSLDKAYQTFEKVINYYDGTLFADKAKVEVAKLELKQKRYANAIPLLKEVAEKRLDDIGAEAQYQLGLAYMEQGEFNEAITAFVRIRSVFAAYDEWFTKSLLRLGDCYLKLNDKKLAREMYRAVLRRHNSGDYADEANKKLKLL